FDVIAQRWTDPQWGTAWRTFDLFLLLFAMTHGTNGLRFVAEDYIHHPGWRVVAKTVIGLLLFSLVVMGAYVIFTF
ncbi:MAG: succinate dehydrogenase, hydrophobic membrane anchor protein, partial [Anaerolineae bacterium]